MAVGIYKSGQGYWVRVMTAVGAGILTLATAAWLWKQVELVPLPKTSWNLTLTDVQAPAATPGAAALKPGDKVDLLEAETTGAEAKVIGHATVRSYTPRSDNNAQLSIESVEMNEKYDPSTARRVVAGRAGAAAPAFSGLVRGTAQGVAMFDLLYLQAGVAGLVILLGSILTYWIVAVKPQTCDFLIATDAEMKKVNWSTRQDVYRSTVVVIGASVLMAAFLFFSDFAFSSFFKLIGVLQK